MFKFLGLVLSLFLTSVVRGFVLVKLWFWFIVPTFAAPQLSIPVALGISLLLNYICGPDSKTDTKSDDFWEVIGTGIFKSIVTALFVLLMGWVFTLFI